MTKAEKLKNNILDMESARVKKALETAGIIIKSDISGKVRAWMRLEKRISHHKKILPFIAKQEKR